jgi:hypothetical protein
VGQARSIGSGDANSVANLAGFHSGKVETIVLALTHNGGSIFGGDCAPVVNANGWAEAPPLKDDMAVTYRWLRLERASEAQKPRVESRRKSSRPPERRAGREPVPVRGALPNVAAVSQVARGRRGVQRRAGAAVCLKEPDSDEEVPMLRVWDALAVERNSEQGFRRQ